MQEVPIAALKQAVEGLHECNARHTGTEHVTETFEGETVWDGDVHIFRPRRPPIGVYRIRLVVSRPRVR